jgi:hypothetical protein
MIRQFDKFGYVEIPNMTLTNPNKEELFSLGLAYNTKLSLKFNALSTFEFEFPQSIDGGEAIIEAYSYLKNKRLVLIENHGYFQIINVKEDIDGAIPTKKVECVSLESELIQKRVTTYSGTRQLYNIITPENTILQDMIELAPNWSVGTVSGELLTKYRTFSVSDSNVYNFLMSDVAEGFEAIFVFDTVSKTISAYTIDEATIDTDIFLSFDNLLKDAEFSEMSDEISTSLSVYGGADLNIRQVNPLGGNQIYDFTYYKSVDWMSQDLVDAITAWEVLVDLKQPDYADGLTLLSTYNGELLVLQSDLADLNSELLALQGVKAVRIQQKLSLTAINADIAAKKAEIATQEVLIDNKNTQIADITLVLQAINEEVSFENNFSPSEILELNEFIYENTYQNENIIQTDSMTLVEIQDAAQALYNQAQGVLSRVSQPRYEINIDAANFVDLQEYQLFTQQTELGCIVTAELESGTYIETVLLEINMQFDDPSDFSLVFSNRLRLDNGDFIYSDLMGQVQKTGSSVSFDSSKWANWSTDYKDDVSTFITSALDATVNNLISNSNQEIIINQNGLMGRKYSPTLADFEPKQVWLTNNVLAFSDDGFETAKLALGEVPVPGGGTAYGIVGEIIVGNMIAGNTLTITNENNNFILDSTGATLYNAKFTLETTNTKILIDPTANRNFRIQKNVGGTFTDKFWVDNSGNVNFSGTLSGADGTFSGTITAVTGNIGTLVIDSQGLKTANGVNYLRGNGDLKWGGLTISGSSATFDGTIFASKISGQVVNNQIATGIDASKNTFGTMSGSRIFAGTISGPGITIALSGTGVPTISGSNGVTLNGGAGGVLDLTSSLGSMYSSNIRIEAFNVMQLYASSLSINGATGLTTSRSISTPIGTRTITFTRGICTGFT